MTAEEVNSTDAPINGVRSAMLSTMFVQMGVSFTAGILIHVLTGTLMNTQDVVTYGMWALGVFMYLNGANYLFWVRRLHATLLSPLPSRIYLNDLQHFLTAYATLKTLTLHCFRRYNHFCCKGPAMFVFALSMMEVIISIAMKQLVALQWPIILGLLGFLPLLACFIYNCIVLRTYEKRLEEMGTVWAIDCLVRVEESVLIYGK